MYVCLCNALTDRDIHAAATEGGASRPAEVFAHCACRAKCGSCVRTVLGMMREALGPIEEEMPG